MTPNDHDLRALMTDSRESSSSFEHTPKVDEQLALIRLRRATNISQTVLEEIRNALMAEDEATIAAKEEALVKSDDLRVRHMIQAGAPWHAVADILWSDYKRVPSPQRAARLLEISFLETTLDETLESFAKIMGHPNHDFYWLLHPRLRDLLLEHSVPQFGEQLYWLLAKSRDVSQLTDVEVLFLFLRAMDSKHQTAAWLYYKRNEERILDCICEHPHFGHTCDQFLLKVGELALVLEHEEEAVALFGQLTKDSDERQYAQSLMDQHESAKFEHSKSVCTERLESLAQWQDRIRMLDEFCHSIRTHGFRDPNRAALNQIFKSVMQWVPRTVESWRSVGELIVRNRDIAEITPGIFQAFYDNACVFHGEDIDLALWYAAVQLQPQTARDAYLSGLGWLHYFVASSRRSDIAIWTSKKMIEYASANEQGLLPWSWQELIHASASYIEKSQQVHERDRKRIIAVLRISLEGANSSPEVIRQYLALSDSPSLEILDKMAEEAWQQGNFLTFIGMSVRGAGVTYYRSSVLKRFWYAATQIGDQDLAWRIATVLASRDSLDARIKQSWSISGERRSVYAPTPISHIDVEWLLNDFSQKSRKVIRSIFVLGAKIAELAEITKRESLTIRPSIQAISTTEKALAKALSETKSGLPSAPKVTFEAVAVVDLPDDIAGLMQSPESNPWLYTNKLLFERFGMMTWGFSRQMLLDLATSILPMIGSTSGRHITAKLGKWLAGLNSQQRAAWSELSVGLSEVSDQEFSRDLLQFFLRLSTVLYPSHFEALKTIQKSRVSLDTLRCFEGFILSSSYGELRRRLGILSQVVVPKNLVNQNFNESGT